MSDRNQQTLTGESASCGRTRPTTLLRCRKCDDYVLRSERFEHEHYLAVASWAAIDRLRERETL